MTPKTGVTAEPAAEVKYRSEKKLKVGGRTADQRRGGLTSPGEKEATKLSLFQEYDRSCSGARKQNPNSKVADTTPQTQRSAQFLTPAGPAQTGSVQVCGQVCRNLNTIYIPANLLRINRTHLHSSRQIPSGRRAEPKKHPNEDTDRLQTRFAESVYTKQSGGRSREIFRLAALTFGAFKVRAD